MRRRQRRIPRPVEQLYYKTISHYSNPIFVNHPAHTLVHMRTRAVMLLSGVYSKCYKYHYYYIVYRYGAQCALLLYMPINLYTRGAAVPSRTTTNSTQQTRVTAKIFGGGKGGGESSLAPLRENPSKTALLFLHNTMFGLRHGRK